MTTGPEVSAAGLLWSVCSGSVLLLGGNTGIGWMSRLHPLLVPSTSKPSLSTRILPHESHFGGTSTLSLSMTLCLSACFLSSECMPRVDCISVGKEFGVELDVYITDAPSTMVSTISQRELEVEQQLTLHQYCPQGLQHEIKFVFSPTLLDFQRINFVSL